MAVVQVIENGGARLEVTRSGKDARVILNDPSEEMGMPSIKLDADDLKALIKRCKVVLSEMEG